MLKVTQVRAKLHLKQTCPFYWNQTCGFDPGVSAGSGLQMSLLPGAFPIYEMGAPRAVVKVPRHPGASIVAHCGLRCQRPLSLFRAQRHSDVVWAKE